MVLISYHLQTGLYLDQKADGFRGLSELVLSSANKAGAVLEAGLPAASGYAHFEPTLYSRLVPRSSSRNVYCDCTYEQSRFYGGY